MTTDGSRKLKIAHITNHLIPGYGYEEIQLSREQQRMGHDVMVITSNYIYPTGPYSVLRRRFPSRRVAPSDEIVDGVRVKRLNSYEVAHRTWIRGLAKSLVEFDADVVHCHNLLQFHPLRVSLLRALGRYCGVIVVDDHMHAGFVRRTVVGRAFYAVYRVIGQPFLERYVDRFCAIGDDTREYLRTECGVKADIQVVPLGVAVGAFAPNAATRKQSRLRLGVDTSDLVYIYVGKVISDKGVHLLVEAANLVSSRSTKVYLLVVGDADEAYERRLAAMAAASRENLELHLIPSVEHQRLPDWYAAADVAVWPREESMAAFEGMAAGLPVVVSAASGLARIVAPRRGLTYEPESAAGLAACLRRLSTSELRQRLGQAGREYAEAELSWGRSAERYVGIYREAIADRRV